MRLRFLTAAQLFEAFPTAREEISQSPTEADPLAFLAQLRQSKTPEDAIGFCAYLLPRREAVFWGCQCLRHFGSLSVPDSEILEVAEAWVKDPEEDTRKLAYKRGMEALARGPVAWMALGAAWSGGTMVQEGEGPNSSSSNVPPAPYLTAQAVRAAILTSVAVLAPLERRLALDRAIQAAYTLMDTSENIGGRGPKG
jgi:hypothetical protein